MCWNTLTITPKTGADDLIIQSQPHPHLQLFSGRAGGRIRKHLSNTTCSASLFCTGCDKASFCLKGQYKAKGGGGCSFSTCFGEQHSQNSFLLLGFFTMLGDVQLMSCTCFVLLLLSRTHTVYTGCTTTWHWHSRRTRVWSVQRALYYCLKKKEGRRSQHRPFIKRSE